jgi:hypothetical protein
MLAMAKHLHKTKMWAQDSTHIHDKNRALYTVIFHVDLFASGWR